jgi:hypothetical protein
MPNIGPVEIILIVLVLGILAAMIGVAIGVAVFFARRKPPQG